MFYIVGVMTVYCSLIPAVLQLNRRFSSTLEKSIVHVLCCCDYF